MFKKRTSQGVGFAAFLFDGLFLLLDFVVKVKWFLDKAEKWKEKRMAVICVGGSPNDNPEVEAALKNILNDEQRKYIKAFYCQGGFDYDKMNIASKLAKKLE